MAEQVHVGQVWRELDPRAFNRHFKVVAIEDGKAVVQNCGPSGHLFGTPKTRIRLDRLRPQYERGGYIRRGYAFVSDG